MKFTLEPLPYAYNALEPFIDEQTMHLHHDKHHQTYVTKLNEALAKHPEYEVPSLEAIVAHLDKIPADIRTTVKNNGGGHYNHDMFWKVLSPASGQKERLPQGDLADAINQSFGSFDKFKEQFSQSSVGHFGSGWGWLCRDKSNKLVALSTHDHDCPISDGLWPLLVVDVWEHAYYLKYQNRRAEFVQAFWSIINWDEVGRRLNQKLSA